MISETNNAAKTASPIQTDIQLLTLIQKRASAAREAAEQFAAAERSDLKEKEDAQVAVLEEYASQVKTLSAEDVNAIIAQQIQKLEGLGTKASLGQLQKALFAKDGPLDGKPANRKEVVDLAKKALDAHN